jgi:hypothetical protein
VATPTDAGPVAEDRWDLELAAEQVDKTLYWARRGMLTTAEAIGKLAHICATAAVESSAGFDDVSLLQDYTRDAVQHLADSAHDPVLLDWFDEMVASAHLVPALEARTQMLLDTLGRRIRTHGYEHAEELVELCRRGRCTHRSLFALVTTPERILRLAHDLCLPEALIAAVAPWSGPCRIARHDRDRAMFVLGLDLLAHIAADPDSTQGREARDGLLRLAADVETAGAAAVRLPVHLLDEVARSRLIEIHEARADLFDDEQTFVPVGLDHLRDSRVVRNAIWQAFDAHRM